MRDYLGIKDYNGKELPYWIWALPKIRNREIQIINKQDKEDKTVAEVKIRKTETSGDYSTETVFEARDIDYLHDDLIKGLFGAEKEAGPEREVKLYDVPVNEPGVKCDVVAIYDNVGIPSIMRRFTRVTDKELFGGSDKPHPAFVIGGEVYDEIYISVYENCNINGKPYSLPFQKAWVNITNDEAAKACFSKGEGWHLLTAAEWGLLANISLPKAHYLTETRTPGNITQTQRNTERCTTAILRSPAAAQQHGRTITRRRECTTFAEITGK